MRVFVFFLIFLWKQGSVEMNRSSIHSHIHCHYKRSGGWLAQSTKKIGWIDGWMDGVQGQKWKGRRKRGHMPHEMINFFVHHDGICHHEYALYPTLPSSQLSTPPLALSTLPLCTTSAEPFRAWVALLLRQCVVQACHVVHLRAYSVRNLTWVFRRCSGMVEEHSATDSSPAPQLLLHFAHPPYLPLLIRPSMSAYVHLSFCLSWLLRTPARVPVDSASFSSSWVHQQTNKYRWKYY